METREYEIITKNIIHMYHMFKQYCIMYNHSERRIELFNKVAKYLFYDMHNMWQEHILLDICKITDKTEQGSNKNLTIYYIIDHLMPLIEPERMAEFKTALQVIEETRNKVKDARSKIIAHIDHEVAINNKLFGGISWEEIENYYSQLQIIVNIAGERLNRGPWPISMTSQFDARDLVEALKKSVHYDRLFSDRYIDKFNEKENWEFKDA